MGTFCISGTTILEWSTTTRTVRWGWAKIVGDPSWPWSRPPMTTRETTLAPPTTSAQTQSRYTSSKRQDQQKHPWMTMPQVPSHFYLISFSYKHSPLLIIFLACFAQEEFDERQTLNSEASQNFRGSLPHSAFHSGWLGPLLTAIS